MVGLLEGQLAKAIFDGFRGKLLKATLWRANAAQSAGLDTRGDPLATVPQTWPCEGFVEAYSEFYRASAGIPETDSRVNLFSKSLPAGVQPMKDDKVQIPAGGAWWQVRKVATDPAMALWVCQAYQCRTPV